MILTFNIRTPNLLKNAYVEATQHWPLKYEDLQSKTVFGQILYWTVWCFADVVSGCKRSLVISSSRVAIDKWQYYTCCCSCYKRGRTSRQTNASTGRDTATCRTTADASTMHSTSAGDGTVSSFSTCGVRWLKRTWNFWTFQLYNTKSFQRRLVKERPSN